MGKKARLKVTGGTAQVAVTGPSGQALPGSSTGVAAAPAANGSNTSNGSK
jgi:hypothetical protein